MPQNREYGRTQLNDDLVGSEIDSGDGAAPIASHNGNGNAKLLLSKLGTRLQQRRVELGLSQFQLSEKAGVNRTYLSDIERGVCNATISMLTKVANALDMKLWALLKELDV
jgi:DNA-binding XRE family transcriptional regulator